MKRILYFIILLNLFACRNSRTIKFAVVADVHQDLIHDTNDRVQQFINTAKNEKVDFIIQLGDFCMPFKKNEPFLKIWDSFSGPSYHVLGNHDLDISPKIVTQDFWGMERSFYSFNHGNFHFIVLDANFFRKDGIIFPYSNGNYFEYGENSGFIPQNQIDWLVKDLQETERPAVIFTHQSLEHWGGIRNREKIRKVFNKVNKNGKKVIACFCGHDHQDRYQLIDGIHYIGINSISYSWGGKKVEYSGRFPKSIEEKYTNLKFVLPYRDPLYAIVTVHKKGIINICGKQSDFIHPGPDELGLKDHSFTAAITSRKLKFTK